MSIGRLVVWSHYFILESQTLCSNVFMCLVWLFWSNYFILESQQRATETFEHQHAVRCASRLPPLHPVIA